MNKNIVIVLFTALYSSYALSEDFCRLAMDKLYKKDSDLIAVVKINTSKSSLYSSTVDVSHDCQHFSPYLSVKDPDAIKTTGGLCMVLPASELQQKLCSMHVTLCIAENNCQSIDIKLETKGNRYVAANPAYYEMIFQHE
ncbi:hypothetical protein [Legionella fallonii]|uniref:Uncharacterized protein n=1 Tax=Legionella fallonii LLAP-10 TaxID=1212491 RepID=A0A098G2E4_9GAMM|nr:hypothetical protein [Legionella fallonii]CEG56151.1 exported protein of unknown function [Legionella fallonii LLAP-10]